MGGDHHDGVPIWVLSRRPPGIDIAQWGKATYTSDIANAMFEAKRAAGDKNVLFHGATVLPQLALAAGLLDELEIERNVEPPSRSASAPQARYGV